MDAIRDKEAWRAKFRATNEAMERIGAAELAAMTDREAWRIIQSLCVIGRPWRDRPDWSGLVEQQALFHKRNHP